MKTQITIDFEEYADLVSKVKELTQQNKVMKQRIDLMVEQERSIAETLAKVIDDIVWNKDCGLMEQYQNE